MNAIDREIEAKGKDVEALESELEALQAEWDREDAAEASESKVVKMICSGACEKCGTCEDAMPQDVGEDNEELIEILKTPCDCETLGIEVQHVMVA